MTDESKTAASSGEKAAPSATEQERAVALSMDLPVVYANRFYVYPTMSDVRIAFGQAIFEADPSKYEVKYELSVYMSYLTVKQLWDMLGTIIGHYEQLYGSIPVPEAPVPEASDKGQAEG